MIPSDGRLVSANSQPAKSFFPGGGQKVFGDLLRRIKLPDRSIRDYGRPGPAKSTTQTATDAIRGGDSSIESGGSKAIVFPHIAPANDFFHLLSHFYSIEHGRSPPLKAFEKSIFLTNGIGNR